MPPPDTFQPPPTAIPEPPAFPSLMETQSPDAYFQAGFWDAWGIWIILASILLAVGISKKGVLRFRRIVFLLLKRFHYRVAL